ncbi:MAG TPA: hypothetical protein VN641_12555 [Urbifossiella sp.]|jgi:hypothetical protein|nr:hypothetical protein [Urbifossiella sp.]
MRFWPRKWLFSGAAVAITALGSSIAQAAWITIKNDSHRVVVVQHTVASQGRSRRCKPVQLLPGESLREFVAPQKMTLDLYDARNTSKLLHSANLAIQQENQTFHISAVKGTMTVSSTSGK